MTSVCAAVRSGAIELPKYLWVTLETCACVCIDIGMVLNASNMCLCIVLSLKHEVESYSYTYTFSHFIVQFKGFLLAFSLRAHTVSLSSFYCSTCRTCSFFRSVLVSLVFIILVLQRLLFDAVFCAL